MDAWSEQRERIRKRSETWAIAFSVGWRGYICKPKQAKPRQKRLITLSNLLSTAFVAVLILFLALCCSLFVYRNDPLAPISAAEIRVRLAPTYMSADAFLRAKIQGFVDEENLYTWDILERLVAKGCRKGVYMGLFACVWGSLGKLCMNVAMRWIVRCFVGFEILIEEV